MNYRNSNLIFGDLATDILGRGNYLRFCARGNSMAPSIRNGAIILVEPVKASQLCINDIVFYRCGIGQHVAHRLVSKSENEGTLVLTTKGDNLKYLDAPVLPEQVLGRVIRIEGRSRRLRIGGMAGWLISRLMMYANYGSHYIQDMLRGHLSRLLCLVGRE